MFALKLIIYNFILLQVDTGRCRAPIKHMTKITVMRVAKTMSFLTQQQQQSTYHVFKVINPAPLTPPMYLNIII